MKKSLNILWIILLFNFQMGLTQNINQFDANGKRHGVWKKNFENTKVTRYEGKFDHGKEVGEFKFYINVNNKPVLSATKVFHPDNNISDVTFYTSKGKVISEGQMDGKKYIGTWKFYQKNSNKLLILENYNDNGDLNGERNVYYENGQIAEKSNYLNGQLEGLYSWFSEKGVKIKELNYTNGELSGPANVYGAEGDLIIKGQYKNGQKVGIWTYYEDGKVTEEKNFSRRINPNKK
ncbi:toxin-antitoxin system YwqK family antitoxin [Gaetbulibacter aestuarii]|uniref:Toxin-antitoxin system YwqK family antitoxin n=1 Tax=Gaetbulibacter aestuarii TaxID=1502358 RepID=A0ABW7N1Q4_9FLAO